MKRLHFRALFLIGLAGLAACGSSGGSASTTVASTTAPTSTTVSASTPAAGTADTVTVKGFAFAAPQVASGATVTVRNEDGTTHTVTSDDGSSFNVKVDGHGTASFTAPTKAGTYAFHCNIHHSMTGQLVVTG